MEISLSTIIVLISKRLFLSSSCFFLNCLPSFLMYMLPSHDSGDISFIFFLLFLFLLILSIVSVSSELLSSLFFFLFLSFFSSFSFPSIFSFQYTELPTNFLDLTNLILNLANNYQTLEESVSHKKEWTFSLKLLKCPKDDIVQFPGCRRSQTQVQVGAESLCRISLTPLVFSMGFAQVWAGFCWVQNLFGSTSPQSFLLGNERGIGPNLFSFCPLASSVWRPPYTCPCSQSYQIFAVWISLLSGFATVSLGFSFLWSKC